MPRVIFSSTDDMDDGTFAGAGVNYVVQTPTGVLYIIYSDESSDVKFIKSTNYGRTWSAPTNLFTGTTISLSVWYDKWSGQAGGLIHVAYMESVTDDVRYRSIDTENSDTLSTETTIYAGTTLAISGASLSIARSRGGNLYCAYSGSATEQGFARSTDVGATWAARATCYEGVVSDQVILMPGWAADNQDMMLFYWDADVNEISRKLYDDSGDAWAETSIATSMTESNPGSNYPNFAAAVDTSNNRNLLVAWTVVSTVNADLRCWHVTESAITEVTNVVLNSTENQGLAGIAIDTSTQDWYVFYVGKSDGTEVYLTSVNVYYKFSTDDGSTWSAETKLSNVKLNYVSLRTIPRFYRGFPSVWVLVDVGGVGGRVPSLVIAPGVESLARSMIGF